MMGRAQCLCMVLTTSSVKRPGWPETPIRDVRATVPITSQQGRCCPHRPLLIRSTGWESLRWKSSWLGILSVMRPESVHHEDPALRLGVSGQPSAFICATICSGDASHPALPAPRKATRFGELGTGGLQAAMRLPRVTAAVP